MIPDQWQKAKELYEAALKIPLKDRPHFVADNCDGDDVVREEVESLLANSADAAGFLEKPAVGEVAEEIVGRRKVLPTNETLSHYKIIELLGTGGMGEVYLAEDTRLHRHVALKVLPNYSGGSQQHHRLQRFLREARVASALNHPNICTIYEINDKGATPFIAMEHIVGKTLDEAIRTGLSRNEFFDIALKVGDALAEAHAQGLVHRDIKPANIVITARGPKVLDFGLAKKVVADRTDETEKIVTQAGMIIGTAGYMSPEQARAKTVDARSDIFSFGVVMYEMVAGKRPFEGESSMDVISSILDKEPTPLHKLVPEVLPSLERVINKALRKDREERFQTVKDLLIDLKDAQQELRLHEELGTFSSGRYDSGTPTGDAVRPTSSAEYLTSEIRKHKTATLVTLTLLVLAIGGSLLWYFSDRLFYGSQIQSIAVLPFENGSGDANLDYLSDGLSESLIDRLSELPQIKVIARSSSFRYRGENINLQDAAAKLGVQAIITGRVVRLGDNLSIRVEMVDTRNDRQLWSEQYNRKATDALVMQQEIAQTVSQKLRLKLSGEQEEHLAKRSTVNPQAYELLLKGRFYWNKGAQPERMKALEYFNQAIAVDPNYALAYAELASSYTIFGNDGEMDQKVALQKAETAARKALELDEGLADAHQALGYIKQMAWDWAGAEQEFTRAVELNPNYALGHASYAVFLAVVSRRGQAASAAQRAKELDPVSIRINIWVFNALFLSRRYDDALNILREMIELDPNHPLTQYYFGGTYMAMGRYQEAINACEESIKLGGTGPGGKVNLGLAYAKAGRFDEARAILSELKSTNQRLSRVDEGLLHAALDEKDRAFILFEKAYAAHDLQLQYLGSDPLFDGLRTDARYKDLERRVGLSQ